MARTKIAGCLEVGATTGGEVVIEGGQPTIDIDGNWYVNLSAGQARELAAKLVEQSSRAEKLQRLVMTAN